MLDLADIARLEERRQADGLAVSAPEHILVAGGTAGRGEPGSWTNQAAGLGMNGPVTRDNLLQIIDFHASKGAEPRLEICPFADGSLVREAGELGFRVANFELVFFRSLDGSRVEPAVPTPPGLVIRPVDVSNAQELREFAITAVGGFVPPCQPIPEHELRVCEHVARLDRVVAMAAWVDGSMAGAGGMEIAATPLGGVAALFGLSVKPQFRRRGVQQSLIAARLNLASSRGAILSTIGSRPGVATERNVRRMGYQVAYTRVALVWPAPGLVPLMG
ncbi:hypothetical protein J4558_04000 [Leptolyngbya sp. 15MV]|nr:hypothetical protein J4558_04000 [Leptolyngbya sp. 15MV]